VTLVLTITSGAQVMTNSNHRLRTKTAEALLTGATKVALVDAGNARVGQRVYITDGTTECNVLVTLVNGNDIHFAAVTLGSTITTAAIACSEEFQIAVYENDERVELWENLSMEDTNSEDFIENQLNGAGNQSLRITLTDLDSVTSSAVQHIPLPIDSTPLTGGADGGTPDDTDYIGSSLSGQEQGAGLIAKYQDVRFICAPGQTSVAVEKELDRVARVESKTCVAILDMPLASDLPDEAVQFREVTLNIDSSYSALYYPWLRIPDPEIDGAKLLVPPSGHVMGAYSAIASERGPFKAPANVILYGVEGLTHDTKAGEHDLLNPAGINVILNEPGRGIRIMGARTLQSRADGYHYVPVRTDVNFIKASVKSPLKDFLYEPITPELLRAIESVLERFSLGLLAAGYLTPKDDPSKAFFVKCDSDTTTSDDVAAGRVNIEYGVNPPRPAEFLNLKISLYDGVIDVEELA
jgi:hypothetical protein